MEPKAPQTCGGTARSGFFTLRKSIPPVVFGFACLTQAGQPAMAQANAPSGSGEVEYVFDTRMFRGTGVSKTLLDRFNQRQSILPGTYDFDVWVNQRFVERLNITLKAQEDGGVTPCLTVDQLDRLGIVPPEAQDAQDADAGRSTPCIDVSRQIPGTIVHIRADDLRLDLQIPQAMTRRIPRGYVNPKDLDAGETVGFVNYMGNVYHTWQQIGASRGSAWLSLQSGVNAGLWQLRHQSSVNWTKETGTRWKSLRTYVQRPLLSIGSQMTLGQTFTRGQFFSGLNYIGVSVGDDERMLPDVQRGYAPVVRGVANSNARVSIRQGGAEIYQTTVPPGAFEISDLYPNSYSGDLDVEVLESDGAVQRYSVPFAAVPESLREGQSHYEVSLGRTYDAGKDSLFGDLIYQRGISNAATLYGGLRLAQGYQALMAGGVYASRIGALGSDLTWSRARLLGRDVASGWMMRLSYSNTITSTGTTVTLANYRYSTTGYQDLGNVLGLRRAGGAWQSSTWQQRNRFDLRMSQELGRWGNVFLSGSLQDYRDGKPRDTQYQLGYGRSFANGVSANIVLMRNHVSGGARDGAAARRETTAMLSLTIPLGPKLPALNATMISGSGAGSEAQMQASFSGALDEAQTLSYSLGGSYDRQARQSVFTANLHKRFSMLTAGVGASVSRHTRQLSANAQGALAVHAGGVTFGHYVGDTFALVYAPNAEGARLLNSPSRIDASGYALAPYLTPYRYNRVTLDPGGMSASTELVDSEQRSAPYAGAVVKLVFQTRRGQAVLIDTVKRDGLPVPFGAEVIDEDGAPVGMVGQGGRIYVRADDDAGTLTVRWGDAASEQCVVPYQFDAAQQVQSPALMRLHGVCG